MSDCIFCEIVAGRAPSSVVYEDELVIAFMDIAPVNPGHTLVIPREHYPDLASLDEAAGMHMFKVAQRMAQAVRASGVRCEGVNLFLADGRAAFQEVFHVHIHVLPRFKGDPFKLRTNWKKKPARSVLDENAKRIRETYELKDHP